MKDAEINLAIAKIEYPDYKIESWISSAAVTPLRHPNIKGIDYMQWCWIGPIIEREGIDILFHGTHWLASSPPLGDPKTYAEVVADKPAKAAALCYLKMKGGE